MTKRLIEEYIPIKAISAEASREKLIRQGNISTLHPWWARRPLVASRAAVFAALVPADARPQIIDGESTETPKAPMTLTKFMVELCKWNVSREVLDEARRLIREAYPDSPPKVLDMFAGGGSIPLEALRLGCEAYALDLNPVAHIIQLATLVYPQRYGPPLADDVRTWGTWVLERVRAEVGDLYPPIPDPGTSAQANGAVGVARSFLDSAGEMLDPDSDSPDADDTDADDPDEAEGADAETNPAASQHTPAGYLQPVAYLWTRTVTCPNPACRATVPLVRQTWLKKKKGDNVALAMLPHPTENRMAFYVRRALSPADFGFDPAGFSKRGSSLCGRCGTTVSGDYVKAEGKAGRMGAQMMATVLVRPGARGKVYLSPDEHALPQPDEATIRARIEALTAETGITPPDEQIQDNDTLNFKVPLYGIGRFRDLFTARQMLTLLTFVKGVRAAHQAMLKAGIDAEYAKAVTTYLGISLSRLIGFASAQATWLSVEGERVANAFGRQSLPMVWDYAEVMPFNTVFAGWQTSIGAALEVLNHLPTGIPARVSRHDARELLYPTESLDSVVTDPPYYDNISYADLSDYFYVWLKRSIGVLHMEHLSGDLTPKKAEAISARHRHKGDKDQARKFYEISMEAVFLNAHRVLKPKALMLIVYAHKTTSGWSTLVDALRNAGFEVRQAWPLDTERPGRLISQGNAALASSIFLVACKRENGHSGNYTTDVEPEMRRIVKERVGFFLEQGITGADLNIATVGAGLAPYTRYARVDLPNGEELTAAHYLDIVQSEVVRVLLGEAGRADPATQYYIMARSYYGMAWVDFDEANTLARATGIELDSGPFALTRGRSALAEKQGAKVRLLDFEARGDLESLGLPTAERGKAPLIDVLHRLLWLIEHEQSGIADFLLNAQPDRYLLRVVAQSLAGRALAAEPTPGAVRDERTAEQRAIDTLLAAWRRLIDERTMV